MIIYRIQNTITGKSYVGQTKKSLTERFDRHKKAARSKVNRYLYDSMNKHGYENFYIEILEEVSNGIDINEREIFWISKLNTLYPNGYNMTSGGGGGFTLESWSDNERKELYSRQANSRMGVKRTESQRRNIANASVIREASKSPEQKKFISEKISNTLKIKGCKPPITIRYGSDNWNFVDIDVSLILSKIQEGKTQKAIATYFNTSSQTIWSKLKPTGKTFSEWRNYYVNRVD